MSGPRSLVASVARYLPMSTDIIQVLRIAEAEFGLPERRRGTG